MKDVIKDDSGTELSRTFQKWWREIKYRIWRRTAEIGFGVAILPVGGITITACSKRKLSEGSYAR